MAACTTSGLPLTVAVYHKIIHVCNPKPACVCMRVSLWFAARALHTVTHKWCSLVGCYISLPERSLALQPSATQSLHVHVAVTPTHRPAASLDSTAPALQQLNCGAPCAAAVRSDGARGRLLQRTAAAHAHAANAAAACCCRRRRRRADGGHLSRSLLQWSLSAPRDCVWMDGGHASSGASTASSTCSQAPTARPFSRWGTPRWV